MKLKTLLLIGALLTVGTMASAQAVTNNNNEELQAMADEVVALVNRERTKRNMQALKTLPQLTQCAALRSVELLKKYSHTRPDGTKCFTILKEHDMFYGLSGENIASGQKSSADVMNAWMHSPGHRANILTEDYTHIGVGVCRNSKGSYEWVQMFIAVHPGYENGVYVQMTAEECKARCDEVVAAINKARIKLGLEPLKCSRKVDKIAAEVNYAQYEEKAKGSTTKETSLTNALKANGMTYNSFCGVNYIGEHSPDYIAQDQLDDDNCTQYVKGTKATHIAVALHCAKDENYYMYWSVSYISCADLGDEYVLK